MQRRTLTLFLFILVLTACAGYIIWPHNPGLHVDWLGIHHPLQVKQGLDLQGGVRVLLVPDPAQSYSTETLEREIDATRDQIEQRINGGLGVNEPIIRVQTTNGQPSISVELPKLTSGNQDEAIRMPNMLTLIPVARLSSLAKTWTLHKLGSVLTSRPGIRKSTSQ